VVVDTTDRPTWSDTAEEVYGDLAGLGFVQVDQEAGVEVWTREGD
jgi:hypothetical protein